MPPPDPADIALRPPAVGDIGWVIHRQALLYHHEHGWNQAFEVLLAGIFAEILRAPDPAKERGWIAEAGGTILGSAFVARETDTVAKLRLLYVEPAARGRGLGRRLVQQCLDFARASGYATVRLWTNDVLAPARRIYLALGFTMTAAEPVHAFGCDMVSETWELTL